MKSTFWSVLLLACFRFLEVYGSSNSLPLFPDVRLVGGPNSTCGRVEMLSYRNVWGTVCDDLWDDLDAFVICRQLGLSGGKAFRNAHFGPGTGPIHLDDVRCTGFEPTIDMCQYTSDTTSLPINCQHNEDASVCCDAPGRGQVYPATTTPAPLQFFYHVCPMRPARFAVPPEDVRLVGNTPGVGYVQTRAPNGTWGYVCDDYFGLDAAMVVCYELCYDVNDARPSMQTQYQVKVARPNFVLDDVMCDGTETHLQNCNHRPFFQHNCGSNEMASVTCIPDNQLQCTNCFSSPPDLQCRAEDMIVIFNLTQTPDLEEKHISFLNSGSSCNFTSYTANNRITIKFRYKECGTEIKQNATHLLYYNTMIIMYTSQFEDITDRSQFRLELSCAVVRNYSASNIIAPRTEVVTQSSAMSLNVTLSFTTDRLFNNVVTMVPLYVVLGSWVNVSVNLHTTDSRMKMIVTDCQATPQNQNPRVPSYPLITNKCATRPELVTVPLSPTRFGFMFQAFGFINHMNIVINCDVLVCLTTDDSAECDQSCNSNGKTSGRRKRRSSFTKQSKKVMSPPFVVVNEADDPILNQEPPNLRTITLAIESLTSTIAMSTTPEAKTTNSSARLTSATSPPKDQATTKPSSLNTTDAGKEQEPPNLRTVTLAIEPLTSTIAMSTTPEAKTTNSSARLTSATSPPKDQATTKPSSLNTNDAGKGSNESNSDGVADMLVDSTGDACTWCLSPLLFTGVILISHYLNVF